MNVGSILQAKGSNIFTVRDTALLADAVEALTDHNIGAVVVLDGSARVAGILSERDIVRQIRMDRAGALSRPISTCMTPKPITCTTETTTDELMAQMTGRRIRHIPVVEGGRLIGLVSIGDVVKAKISEAEAEAEALREYIAS